MRWCGEAGYGRADWQPVSLELAESLLDPQNSTLQPTDQLLVLGKGNFKPGFWSFLEFNIATQLLS